MSFIETERLLIRTWMPSDTGAMAAILSDPQTVAYVGFGNVWSLAETRDWIERSTDVYERQGIGMWPVVLKATGEVVGECGLQPLSDSDDVELGFLLKRSVWGKNYGYEASAAVLYHGFEQRQLDRIIALVDPRNTRSIALLARLGMHFDRVVRARRKELMKYVKRRGET